MKMLQVKIMLIIVMKVKDQVRKMEIEEVIDKNIKVKKEKEKIKKKKKMDKGNMMNMKE